jgi:hypothetical protein
MPTVTKKLYLRVAASNSWEENYDAGYPYKFYISDYEGNSSSSWVIEEFSVQHNFKHPTRTQIIDVQVNGLKACISEANAECHSTVTGLQEQINNLLALPDLSNV